MNAPSTSALINTFTPIFDAVVHDVGLVGASVYGRIWRFCQGERQCCDAALATIAKDLDLSTRTIMRWTDELCKKGYLKDHTPDLKNKPHTYTTTNKLRLVVEVRAEVDGVTESHPTVTESHSGCDRESLEETSNRQEETEEPTATPSQSDPPPSTLNAWLDKLKEPGCNRVALLRWMITLHFPDNEPPSFGKVGILAKRLHAGRLAQLIWENSGRRITGCPLDYLQAVSNGQDKGNGGSSTPREPASTFTKAEQEGMERAIARINERAMKEVAAAAAGAA